MIVRSPKFNAMNREKFDVSIIPDRWKIYFTDPRYEIEARFKKNRNLNGLTNNDFVRIRNWMNVSYQSSQVELYEDGIRKITYGDEVYWERKSSIDYKKYDDYGIKFTVAEEIPIDDPKLDQEPRLVRQRERYTIIRGSYKIELTRVIEDTETRHELEVEYLFDQDVESPIYEFMKGVTRAYKLMMDSDLIYNFIERSQIYRDINILLGGKSDKFKIIREAIPDARDLRYKDFVWGGIVGNPKTTYHMTHKADGVRKYLYVSKIGIWLVTPSSEVNLILNFSRDDNIEGLIGILLETEDIPVENRTEFGERNEIYDIWVHDGVSVSNSQRIINESHIDRMEQAGEMCQYINHFMRKYPDILICRVKTFIELVDIERTEILEGPNGSPNGTRAGIFDTIRSHAFAAGYGSSDEYLLPYKTDGFIFMPNKAPYNKLGRSDTAITLQPRILKWKPENMLTIDFKIAKRGDVIALMDRAGPFVKKPYFDGFIQNSEFFIDIPSGGIVEFGWNGQTFYPIKFREDKEDPNGWKTTNNIWSLIMNPINLSTIIGDDMKLYRKYHNRCKRWLYREAPGKILLDLGSGIGGDIYSWEQYEMIIAVEPDLDKEAEFFKRISDHDFNIPEERKVADRIFLLQTGSENYEFITQQVREITGGRKVDVISAMFSLTFLWQNERMFNGLIQTIERNLAPKGKFIFAVMNGDAVRNFMGDNRNEWIKFNEIANLNYRLVLEGDRLFIDFPDTLTVPSEEPLTRLSDLLFALKGYDHVFYTLDSERLLPKLDLQLSAMYTAAVFTKPPEVFEPPAAAAPRTQRRLVGRPSTYRIFLDDYEVGSLNGDRFVAKRHVGIPQYESEVLKLLVRGIKDYVGKGGDLKKSHFDKEMTLEKKDDFIHSGDGCFDILFARGPDVNMIRNEDWRSY